MQVCICKYKESTYNLDERYNKLVNKYENKNILKFKINDTYKFIVTCQSVLGVCIANIQTCQASTGIVAKVDAKGWELFGICKGVGFWAAVIFMVIDIIKSVKKEDISGIIRICIKYSVWYATIYFAPDIIMMAVNLFK